MKLSQETVIGLKRLCSIALISDTDFQNLLTDCAQSIALEEAISKQKTDESKLDAMKAAHASLTVLFTEGARHDLDGFMIKTVLDGYNLATDRVNLIVETYKKYRTFAQQRLKVIGTNLPQIVNVHWKMDYTVRSSGSRNLLVPYFYIELVTVTSCNSEKIIRFVCSVQNLEELIFLLKSAVRHMNRIGNMLK